MRLRGLMRKEFLQIVRDPSSISIAFVMPVFLLLLFGYGVSLDAEEVPIAVVMEAFGGEAVSFAAEFRHSRYFDAREYVDMREAVTALRAREVDGIIRMQADFAERIGSPGPAPIQLILNGVDANTAELVSGYVQGSWLNWLQHRAEQAGQQLDIPVEVEQRIWFNPEVRSRNFLVPGLVAIIMTLIGALLTALVMAREWERGTMEALLVTPVSMTEILLGKLIPYFILGTGGMLLSVAMAVWLFEVPLRGSFGVLFAAASLFLLVALGMGLLISITARTQFVAGQVAILTTFLPAFILSGFIFDINSMPWFIEGLTYAIAARYFVAILQSVFLAGDIWSVIVPNALALMGMAVLFLGLSRSRSRKRLE
ncbi:ABC transporter permease [Thiohalomonas denitrificans]|uniref:ABC transporter permease n=1 Tax=Thiohalomonas denitrificans TaxID=415747 RepID=UPI0026E9E2E9|nr:ABC transporter permease [Thiohalomonas denitrificans]